MIDRLRRRIAVSEREGGFTLIELLVVIIIIGILLGIAIPSYLGFRHRAQDSTAGANLRSAIPAVEAFFSDNGEDYTGMDIGDLQLIDAGVSSDVAVVSASATDYCISSTHNTSDTYYKDGPAGAIVHGVACT